MLDGSEFDANMMDGDSDDRLFEKEIKTTENDGENDSTWLMIEMQVDVSNVASIVVGCLAPAEPAGGQ